MSTKKSVSNTLCKFHKVSSDRLALLKSKTIKSWSEVKMMWGVHAYQEWRNTRLAESYNCDIFMLI